MLKLNLYGLTKWEEYIANYLLKDYINLIQKDLSAMELTIKNVQSYLYPQTCPKRMNLGQKEDYIIYLCYKSDHWCRMIYQLAHELGHFFMDCYPQRQILRWIDECICELFSIIFLSRSISYFQIFSSDYVESVKGYISDYLKKAVSYSLLSCSELVAQKISELGEDPTEDGINGRPRNCFIAAKLFDAIGSHGRGVSAICLFKELDQTNSINEFFDLWQSKCRFEDETYFVKTIREILGL